MIASFSGIVDSISEDGFVVFVGKPGGYKLPKNPEDVAAVIRTAFRAGATLEVLLAGCPLARRPQLEERRLIAACLPWTVAPDPRTYGDIREPVLSAECDSGCLRMFFLDSSSSHGGAHRPRDAWQ